MIQRMYLKNWMSSVVKYYKEKNMTKCKNMDEILNKFVSIQQAQDELRKNGQTIVGTLLCNIGFFPVSDKTKVIMKVLGESTYVPERIDIFTLNLPKEIVYDIFGYGEVELSLRTGHCFKRDISFEI